MLIAALETATRAGSVAVCDDGVCHSCVGDARRLHGERLPGELTDWVEAHGRDIRAVDLFAIVSGPGSFTGLRVGMATIQGLALAGRREVVGISTLQALEAAWMGTDGAADSVLVSCLDGQRGEVFASAVAVGGTATEDRVLEPTAVTPGDLAAWLAERFSGRTVAIVGDGGLRYAETLHRALPEARIADAPVPLAEAAARLAVEHADRAVAPHALRPVYLRRPDAVLARKRSAAAPPARETDEFVVSRVDSRDDLAEVEARQRQTFTNPWGAEAIRWELEHTDVARLYLMHDRTGVLVAYCACWVVVDELHINSLAVHVDRRRQGLARRLLRRVFAEATGAGARAATLEVRASNLVARRLYEGLGFKVEGVRRDYYQDPREDAIILWRRTLEGLRRRADRGPEG